MFWRTCRYSKEIVYVLNTNKWDFFPSSCKWQNGSTFLLISDYVICPKYVFCAEDWHRFLEHSEGTFCWINPDGRNFEETTRNAKYFCFSKWRFFEPPSEKQKIDFLERAWIERFRDHPLITSRSRSWGSTQKSRG